MRFGTFCFLLFLLVSVDPEWAGRSVGQFIGAVQVEIVNAMFGGQ